MLSRIALARSTGHHAYAHDDVGTTFFPNTKPELFSPIKLKTNRTSTSLFSGLFFFFFFFFYPAIPK